MINSIDNLIKMGEGYELEFKENIEKSLAKEVCAFANANGGKIIIGISDDGKLKPISSDKSNRIKSQAQDIINKIEPKVSVIITYTNGLIIIDVAEGNSKPHYCSDGFFLRIGANSQKLTRNEIIEMSKREGAIKFDTIEHQDATFKNDFDSEAYDYFLEKAQISSSIPSKQLLKNLKCMTDNVHFTNAGVLFFTKSIDYLLRQAVCTCVLYKGIDKYKILDRKDYKANMLMNIDNAVSFVQRHTNLEYIIEHVQRENVPEIPEIALREAIVNAFCHRYYFEEGSNITVEVFDDRVIVSSFGGLPPGLPAKKFGKESVSVQRNPIIADLLLRANYIEKVGTGIQRIKKSVDELGKGKVKFSYDEHWFFVVFTRNQPSIKKVMTTQNPSESMLTNRQQEILNVFKVKERLTTAEIEEKLNNRYQNRVIRLELTTLKNLNYVDYIGKTRIREWFLTKS